MYYGDWYERRERIRPANGIRARTQRGQFGQTWWAGRWIAALERLVDIGRLSRGRTYARSGQVVSLDVGRKGVRARVQGSYPEPYDVTIGFRTLTDAEWDRVIDALVEDAIYAAHLLAGEMPEPIEEVFTAVGVSLFPAKSGDLETDCSCPDWANPCKHVAAVHYLLGERFDDDPFLIFELRGRSKDEIIAGLRARRSVGGAVEEPAPVVAEIPLPDAPATEPLAAESVAAFWSAPDPDEAIALHFTPPIVDALPVKRLGPPGFWPDADDFTRQMERAYQIVARAARRRAFGEDKR